MKGHVLYVALITVLKMDTSAPKSLSMAPSSQQTPDDQDEEAWFVCKNCRQRLSRPSHRAHIQGSHTHTFANPSGIVYEIACFQSARGCGFIGSPSTEFAWFAGYSWRITICADCQIHLGWSFSAANKDGFFGFITDRIILQSQP